MALETSEPNKGTTSDQKEQEPHFLKIMAEEQKLAENDEQKVEDEETKKEDKQK